MHFLHILCKYAYKYTTFVVVKSDILSPLLTSFLSKNYHFLLKSVIPLKSDKI